MSASVSPSVSISVVRSFTVGAVRLQVLRGGYGSLSPRYRVVGLVPAFAPDELPLGEGVTVHRSVWMRSLRDAVRIGTGWARMLVHVPVSLERYSILMDGSHADAHALRWAMQWVELGQWADAAAGKTSAVFPPRPYFTRAPKTDHDGFGLSLDDHAAVARSVRAWNIFARIHTSLLKDDGGSDLVTDLRCVALERLRAEREGLL